MPAPEEIRIRSACPADADAIAALHADSWRRHYRGAYSDAFLDGDVVENRLAVWSERLSGDPHASRTTIAECGREMVGFVHTVLEGDATWGALVENLHVIHAGKRRGIGTRLLASAAQSVLDSSPSRGTPARGIYLWVLEQNADARAFYATRGAICAERDLTPPPGGDLSQLNGRPVRLRYAWGDPSELLAGLARS